MQKGTKIFCLYRIKNHCFRVLSTDVNTAVAGVKIPNLTSPLKKQKSVFLRITIRFSRQNPVERWSRKSEKEDFPCSISAIASIPGTFSP